jgi:hypothetical protein
VTCLLTRKSPEEVSCSSCGAINIILHLNDTQHICTTCGYFFEKSLEGDGGNNNDNNTSSIGWQSSFGTLAQRRSLAVLSSFEPLHGNQIPNRVVKKVLLLFWIEVYPNHAKLRFMCIKGYLSNGMVKYRILYC